MTLSRAQIEREIEVERGILETLQGPYQRRRQVLQTDAFNRDDLEAGLEAASKYPIFPNWQDIQVMRIKALEIMLETAPAQVVECRPAVPPRGARPLLLDVPDDAAPDR